VERTLFTPDYNAYRTLVREFVSREVAPNLQRWEDERLIDRHVWRAAGKQGIIGLAVPEEFGGSGQADFRYQVIIFDEFAKAGATSLGSGFSVQDNIVIPYVSDLGTDEQKRRWLPGLAAGEIIGAIAMTEPGAGSDVQGIRTTAAHDDGTWVINGQKTFITNGINADLVIVVARTNPGAGARGFSLIIAEAGAAGFSRGPKLDKIGLHAQDTAELFFDDVRVPAANLLGAEGRGFPHLMERLPRERLSIAVAAASGAEAIFAETKRYCFGRKAFGQLIGDFQHTRFQLADISTELDVTRAYLDAAVLALNAGTLSATDAAKAKWWATELQKRVVDRCLQLHGGYGYMLAYPVAQAFLDSRVQTIYGGTTEITKEIIGRDIARSES